MSQQPKKYHGPELKCGGPGMCSDCTEKAKIKRDKAKKIINEILETHKDVLEKLKDG